MYPCKQHSRYPCIFFVYVSLGFCEVVKNWFVWESDVESGNVAGASEGDANIL